MTTDWKALCESLIDEWDAASGDPDLISFAIAIDRARAALAQPEPVERPIWTEGICGDGAAILKDGVMQPIEDVIAALNATALAQPEPVGPTDEELYDLAAEYDGEPTQSMRAALARWGRPAITPIPVSDRLPGADDCDVEGRCWYFSFETVIGGANWQLFTEEEQEGFVPPTHWLPATALPLPSPNCPQQP
jgi:hypothetical protein